VLPSVSYQRKEAYMISFKTFYLSQIIGKKVLDANDRFIGTVSDLLIGLVPLLSETMTERAEVIGIKLKSHHGKTSYFITGFEIQKIKRKIGIICNNLEKIPIEKENLGIFLAATVLDKQIVDINGRKLVRVNDIRMVIVTSGLYAIAVDIGLEGLLRRIGLDAFIQKIFSLFRFKIPSKYILWDDVEAIDYRNLQIKLSTPSSKLHTLHPSDLADLIEELDKASSRMVFESLDEEKAADVLEELEPHAQVHMIESLPVEKAADVLEKMPADEAADILEGLETDKAETLLTEMEQEASDEVRELLKYPEKSVGSIMSTDFLAFHKYETINEVLSALRDQKPEEVTLYSLFVTDLNNKLIANFSLRDLVISEPELKIESIMNANLVSLYDEDDIDTIADVVSKYNLLAVPVTDRLKRLQGVVVVDDIVEDLINKGRTKR
jgi:CBS domain-containing protein